MKDDILLIESVSARTKVWLHPISNHIVIKTEDWSSVSVDRGNGEEEEDDYGCAGIMLDKKRAIQLRNKLDELILIMNP